MELLYQNMLTNNTNNILSRHLSTTTFINRGFSTDILFFNNTHMNITCTYTYVWMHTCTHTHTHEHTQVTDGSDEGTLKISPTCASISKYVIVHQKSGAVTVKIIDNATGH